MIEVKNITKIYGKRANAFKALDKVSFNLKSNQTIAIVGKSGSGKSTLMHIMSGLDRPQSGQVIIDGQNILKLDQAQIDQFRANKIGFVFQSFYVQGKETCAMNVSLPLEIAKVPLKSRKAKIEKALESVGLLDKIDSLAKDLSGGQKQRLAIARAIVNQPAILFADEPTGNLDSQTGKQVEKLLFDYSKNNQTMLIIVTHDQELALKCDIQLKIKDGKIEQIIRQKETK